MNSACNIRHVFNDCPAVDPFTIKAKNILSKKTIMAKQYFAISKRDWRDLPFSHAARSNADAPSVGAAFEPAPEKRNILASGKMINRAVVRRQKRQSADSWRRNQCE